MIADLFLCLLVLINLLFIHVTGIVPGQWSAGFAVLIVIAPWLRRLAERLAWRVAWDGIVIALFGILLLRTMRHGAERMLESGLILAMFCQIHLVNNLSSRQRPDLLLFNSFIIAIITAFFAQEVSYCAVFVAYAYTFTLTWKLVAWRDAPSTALAPVIRDSVQQATWVLVVTGAVFLFWPRDFEREGLVSARLLQVRHAGSDFVDQIGLERHGGLQSNQVVMRIRGPEPVPTHWRTTTFQVFDTAGWHADRTLQTDRRRSQGPLWRSQGVGSWQRPGREGGARYEVECTSTGGRIPLPLTAGLVVLDPATADVPHMPLADGTLALFGMQASTRYVAECEVVGDAVRGRFGEEDRTRIEPWLGIDRGLPPRAALELAGRLRADLGPDVAQNLIVESLRAYLQTEFEYGLPGEAGSARSLQEFFTSRRGHCEFFASALALMLRSLDIPCRVVGGFLAVERDEAGTTIVRALHAHAWVEVLDPHGGWTTVDATPASLGDRVADDESRLLALIRAGWRRITEFGGDDRRRAVAWLVGLPAQSARAAVDHPLAALAIVACLGGWLTARRRGRPRIPTTVRAYRRLARRLGLALAPGETPRQRLARARGLRIPAPGLAALEAATTAHEHARYRRRRTAPSR